MMDERFYGDFFFKKVETKPTYSGIYRFVNNPEVLMGQAAFWGLAMMGDTKELYLLAVIQQLSAWYFVHYVETPHMRKKYGEASLRKEPGWERLIKKISWETGLTLAMQRILKRGQKFAQELERGWLGLYHQHQGRFDVYQKLIETMEKA